MDDQQLGLSLVSEYDDQIAALKMQRAAAVAALKENAIAKMKGEIETLGITAADLGFDAVTVGAATEKTGKVVAVKSKDGKVEPKYIDPVSGKTWTGRGKAPKWIDGQDRAPFLIGAPDAPETQPKDPVQEPADTTGEFTEAEVTREPAKEAA